MAISQIIKSGIRYKNIEQIITKLFCCRVCKMTFITLQGLQPKSINKPTLSKYSDTRARGELVKENTANCRKSLKLANKAVATFCQSFLCWTGCGVKENESGIKL